MRSIVNDVVRDFRKKLTDLLDSLGSGELTPEAFGAFLGGLKRVTNETGLRTFVEVVKEFEHEAELFEHGGMQHRFKQVSNKEWITPFGLAEIPRRYFQPDRGGEGVAPVDVRCGMVGRYMTPDVEEICALSSALLVPRRVEQLLAKVLPYGPSAKAIQRVVHDAGSFAERNRDVIEARIREQAPLSSNGNALVVSWDGGMVPMREKGEAGWREAGVGTISIYQTCGEDRPEPERTDSRYVAQMPETGMATLIAQLASQVAELRAHRDFDEFAVICDGKRTIWNTAESTAAFADGTFILDFCHAKTHVSGAFAAVFGAETSRAKKWSERWGQRLILEDGAVDGLRRALQRYLRAMKPGTERHKTVRRAIGYFSDNRDRMRYPDFIARGLPIGSGPVEAACKTVLEARLKCSGMRWSRDGGQNVLNLRVHVLSQRWDAFWHICQGLRCAA